MIKNIFPTPLYFSRININNSLLKEEIMHLLEEKQDFLKSGVDGYRINITQDIVDNKNLQIGFILEKIQIEIVEYCKQLKISNQKIVNSWININPKHAYNKKHFHSKSYISGAYYVDVPLDSNSDIIFHRSREFSDYGWSSISLEENDNLKSFLTFSPKTSDLVLFPSFIEHEVLPNHSNDSRISISFNTDIM